MARARGVTRFAGRLGTDDETRGPAINVEGRGNRVPQRRADGARQRVLKAEQDPIPHPDRELRLGDTRDRQRSRLGRRAVIDDRERDRRQEHREREDDEGVAQLCEGECDRGEQEQRKETRTGQRERGETAQRGTSSRARTRRQTASASSPSISASALRTSR